MEITIFQRMNFHLFLLLDSWSVDPWFVVFLFHWFCFTKKEEQALGPGFCWGSVRYRTFDMNSFPKKRVECSQSCTKSVFCILATSKWYDTSTLWITYVAFPCCLWKLDVFTGFQVGKATRSNVVKSWVSRPSHQLPDSLQWRFGVFCFTGLLGGFR